MSEICMILKDSQFGKYHQQFQSAELLHCSGKQICFTSATDNYIYFCIDCGCELTDMSAVPQGAFAACKVRANEEKFKKGFSFQQRTDKFAFNNCMIV